MNPNDFRRLINIVESSQTNSNLVSEAVDPSDLECEDLNRLFVKSLKAGKVLKAMAYLHEYVNRAHRGGEDEFELDASVMQQHRSQIVAGFNSIALGKVPSLYPGDSIDAGDVSTMIDALDDSGYKWPELNQLELDVILANPVNDIDFALDAFLKAVNSNDTAYLQKKLTTHKEQVLRLLLNGIKSGNYDSLNLLGLVKKLESIGLNWPELKIILQSLNTGHVE